MRQKTNSAGTVAPSWMRKDMNYMTRDKARAYFKTNGLAYSDIEYADLFFLELLLNEQFNRQLQENYLVYGLSKPIYWIHVNYGGYNARYDERDRITCAFLTGEGSYFDAREVISFNADGFIGFCGEASDENTEPVLTAFVKWCDFLERKKNLQEGAG